MTSSTQTLTAEQVCAVVQALIKQRLNTKIAVADHFGVGYQQLRKYEKNGLPDKMNGIARRAWLRAAAETGVTATDESIVGVFL